MGGSTAWHAYWMAWHSRSDIDSWSFVYAHNQYIYGNQSIIVQPLQLPINSSGSAVAVIYKRIATRLLPVTDLINDSRGQLTWLC